MDPSKCKGIKNGEWGRTSQCRSKPNKEIATGYCKSCDPQRQADKYKAREEEWDRKHKIYAEGQRIKRLKSLCRDEAVSILSQILEDEYKSVSGRDPIQLAKKFHQDYKEVL